jgi:peptidoglycan/LPS O-acetylase OafA/YrhL
MAPAAVPSKQDGWPALDGVRAVAVLDVMLGHLFLSHLQNGQVGVDVFFVLSGFLITLLLIAEYDRLRAISFRDFYARRALRLFPALAVVLIVVSVAAAP